MNRSFLARVASVVLLLISSVFAAEPIVIFNEAKPNGGWGFDKGAEFPGAKGSLSIDAEAPKEYQPALKLDADFTKGGNYVQCLSDLPKKDIEALSFWVKGTPTFTMRLIDSSGQCHQIKLSLPVTDEWQQFKLPLTEFFENMGTSSAVPGVKQYEFWGGKKDSRWHGPGTKIAILHSKTGALRIGAVTAIPVQGNLDTYRESFEADALPKDWTSVGTVGIVDETIDGKKALRLQRTLETLQSETRAVGAPFPARAGAWRLSGAMKSALESPDESFQGTITLEALNAEKAVIEKFNAGYQFGKKVWTKFSKDVELPEGTRSARFTVELQKTWGDFAVDNLTAADVTPAGGPPKLVDKIRLSSTVAGNLFLPEEAVKIQVKVEALRPLPEKDLQLTAVVRDYWGDEQAAPLKMPLTSSGKDKTRVFYSAEIDLKDVPLAVGRFYELHVSIPRPGGAPYREFTGIARLPEAPSKKFKPAEIPFTIRNWDNRIKEYFVLSDRIGLRQIGLWGGWGSKAPYKPTLPGLDTIEKLDAQWLTTTPAATVERTGFKEYTEESLKQGMTNFLKEFPTDRLSAICIGNEPHGTDAKMKENVVAYKAIYEAVKAHDPKITVFSTSVEPAERMFEAGYHNYLDAYDFHIYESYRDVRRTMKEYRALMEKYNAKKPIHSTELGLNSQGQTREAVACEMVKKFAVFFAEGGSTVSWFTIMYPDPQGKARGTSGDAFCIFDCKYSQYNPRMDAITHYQMINTILDKKFVEEKQYADGTEAYLFRDARGECVQILWREKGRKDVGVPLNAEGPVKLLYIDGRAVELAAPATLATVSVSAEPIVLTYKQAAGGLGELAEPKASALEGLAVKPGERVPLTIRGAVQKENLRISAPRGWKVAPTENGDVTATVDVPPETPMRKGRVTVQILNAAGGVEGELLVPVTVQ